MKEKLLFSTILKDIKEKEKLSNAQLAISMDCSESAVSLYLAKKAMIPYDRIISLKRYLSDIKQKDIYSYIFSHFDDGYYHGSRQGIEGEIDPERNYGKSLDFGHGFYLGTTFRQSSTFVSSEDSGRDRIYKFSFSLDGLDYIELRDIKWVFFVAYNRKHIADTPENYRLIRQIRKIINHGYDVIIGPIADDKMALSMDNFFNDRISYGQLIDCLTQLNIGDQYCLKTKKACDALKREVEYICQDDGLRKIINEYSLDSTQKASRHAEAVNKQRDNGKKYSELLKEYGKKPLF